MSLAASLLAEVLASTPPAPSADADPAEALERAQAFLAARRPILERMRDALGPSPTLDEEDLALRDRIRALDEHWEALLERGRIQLGDRITTVRRAYGR